MLIYISIRFNLEAKECMSFVSLRATATLHGGYEVLPIGKHFVIGPKDRVPIARCQDWLRKTLA